MRKIIYLAIFFLSGYYINATTDIDVDFIYSANDGDFQKVKYYLSKGTDINARNFFGSTALMNASNNGYEEIVKYLLSKGANVNIRDKDGMTALINSINSGNINIVKMLLQSGANINNKSNDGVTVFTMTKFYIDAGFSNPYKEILALLLEVKNRTN